MSSSFKNRLLSPLLSYLLKPEVKSFWAVFASTFLTIFLAEMGDKTQLATLLMSAESRSPWVVFTGSALALVATSLVGVTIGVWIARRLTPSRLNFGVALLLLLITALLVNDILEPSPL